MNLLTNKQIENLHHTACRSFIEDQFYRFEYYDNKNETNYSLTNKIQEQRKKNLIKNFPDKNCVLYFYNNQLEAKICYNYFNKKHKALLCCDLAEMENNKDADSGWCIIIKSKKLSNQFNK